MKGIILAGGLGTRLYPLTKITNKHLLPIYDKPMIYYPMRTLVEAGVREVMVVTGGNNAGDFLKLLGNGSEFGLKQLHFTYQEREGGIAEAIGLCSHFADNHPIIVILGDNIIQKNLAVEVAKFKKQAQGARIFLKRVKNPREYGVAYLKNGTIERIVEKPRQSRSDLAVTGIYMYDNSVFEIIRKLKPSRRGELEITDVNNAYIKAGTMKYSILRGGWADAGESIAAYNKAIDFVRNHWDRQRK